MHTPHNTIKHTHAKISINTLIELQVSQGDTNGEVVDEHCKLGYTSKKGK